MSSVIDKVPALFTGKYDGRDKFAKVMQFATKFVAYHMLLRDPKNELAIKLSNFDKTIGTARKGMRLGKPIEMYPKLMVALGKDLPMQTLAMEVITNVGMAFRWFYDNLAFLEKAKVLTPNNYGVTSNKFRSVAGFFYIIMTCQNFLKANEACNKDFKGDEKAKAKADSVRFEAFLAFFARLCDMSNAMHSAKWYVNNNGIQGACGFISSFIGLRKVWLALK